MTIKHVAVLAAMAIFAGVMISSAEPAQADKFTYTHICSFGLRAPGEAIVDEPIYVYVQLTTSTSGASVLANSIVIENILDREIILDVNRWQSDDGTQMDRGPAEDIPSYAVHGRAIWYPETWISFEKNPSVVVHAYAKSRPGMKGGVICLARPAPGG
jgi:hypothetical protein